MQHSKLIELLKTFNTRELREFGEFVSSPYFNKNQELADFYFVLKKLAPDFPPKKTSRKAVFKKCYPKQPYSDKQLNYLMSFLLKLAEQYIGLTHFREQDALEQFHTLAAYSQRGLEKHYSFVRRQVDKALQEHPYRNTDYYGLKHRVDNLGNRHFLAKSIRKYDANLQLAADGLDDYFLAQKMRYLCEMLDRNRAIAAEYELKMVDEVKGYLQKYTGEMVPPVAIYFQVLMMLLEGNNTTYFKNLKQLIRQTIELFPKDDKQEIYSYAFNYCIRKVNKGDGQFLEELFDLYTDALHKEILFKDSYLSPWAYKNLIGVGLRLQKYDWTESFINEYTDKLAPEFRENAWHYNLAELSYYRKDYDKALTYLNQVEFTDIYYSLDSKKMMLKIYYELEEVDALFSLIASFKMYLKRTKLASQVNKDAYVNFIRVLSLIMKNEPKLFPQIEAHLNNPAPLGDRQWLKVAFEQINVR